MNVVYGILVRKMKKDNVNNFSGVKLLLESRNQKKEKGPTVVNRKALNCFFMCGMLMECFFMIFVFESGGDFFYQGLCSWNFFYMS